MAAERESLLSALTELSEPMDTTYTDNAITSVINLCNGYDKVREQRRLGTVGIPDYVEKTVPAYSDPMFLTHFRMKRSSFQELLELIGPHCEVRTISLERRTLACMWYLSNQETYRSVVDRFGLNKSSLRYYLMNFANVMTGESILPKLISWPHREDYPSIANMNGVRGFPGAIGFIDGTYIPIPGPAEFRDSYICRKQFPAFHLQGVCDSRLKFLDVFSAYPGSVHDARVYRNSPIANHLEREPLPEEFHLLGDSAYALSSSMLVPYRDNGHLSRSQKKYNSVHSSTRVDIERCFGLLKGKFRKLKYLDMRNVRDIPFVIVTCCALHNFILTRESFEDEDIDLDWSDRDDPMLSSGRVREQHSGVEKRNNIRNMLS